MEFPIDKFDILVLDLQYTDRMLSCPQYWEGSDSCRHIDNPKEYLKQRNVLFIHDPIWGDIGNSGLTKIDESFDDKLIEEIIKDEIRGILALKCQDIVTAMVGIMLLTGFPMWTPTLIKEMVSISYKTIQDKKILLIKFNN